MIFEGALSVKSALLNDKRDIDIIYIDKDKKDRDTRFIQKVAADKKVKVKLVSRSYIDEVASGKSHGGIILKASERRYDALKREPFIFVVDGIEDPFNLGYIFRTLKAFGFTSIIIPKRDLSTMEQTIMKSSAGAFDMVDIYQSDDLRKDLSELKKEYPDMTGDSRRHGNGPAVYYSIPGFAGGIGFISAVSNKFCENCNRMRLTSTGVLKYCLCFEDGSELKSILRDTEMSESLKDERLREEFRRAMEKKPKEHCFEDRSRISETKEMFRIGG